MTNGVHYQVVTEFIQSEFRASALMAQQALSALRNANRSEAREHVMKARLYFMAALVHLRHGLTNDQTAYTEADRLDDSLREIEMLIEQESPI